MKKSLLIISMVLITGLLLTGCEGLLTGEDGTGELALFIADAPVNEIDEVNVTLDSVEVNREGESWKTIQDFSDEDNGRKTFNLLDLRFDEELLGQEMLPTGNYTQIRLIVVANEDKENSSAEIGESYVSFKDDEKDDINLFIPSGEQTGLKIHHDFLIEEDIITRLLLDNDVREILNTKPENADRGYILRPTAIEVIDKNVSGEIEGQVVDQNEEAITDYDVVVEALDENDELVTDTVASTDEENDKPAGSFRLRGLDEEGTYSVDAYIEDDEGDIIFEAEERITDIEVEAGEVTELEDKLIIDLSDEENNDD